MRVITGAWKGRRLVAAPGARPTSDRVREALFSMLGGALDGLFVDLYAGSGAVGLEAASRGAQAVLVERRAEALDVLRTNVQSLDGWERVRAFEADALRFVKSPPLPREELPARFVFADPPYDYRPVAKLLRLLGTSPLVGASTTVVLEHAARGRGPGRATDGLELARTEAYGESAVSVFRLSSSRDRASLSRSRTD